MEIIKKPITKLTDQIHRLFIARSVYSAIRKYSKHRAPYVFSFTQGSEIPDGVIVRYTVPNDLRNAEPYYGQALCLDVVGKKPSKYTFLFIQGPGFKEFFPSLIKNIAYEVELPLEIFNPLTPEDIISHHPNTLEAILDSDESTEKFATPVTNNSLQEVLPNKIKEKSKKQKKKSSSMSSSPDPQKISSPRPRHRVHSISQYRGNETLISESYRNPFLEKLEKLYTDGDLSKEKYEEALAQLSRST